MKGGGGRRRGRGEREKVREKKENWGEGSPVQRGVTALTNAVSGHSQNCSGNLEIFPGIGTLRNFSGKHAKIPGHCREKSGHQRRCIPKIREDDPNFRDV